MDRNKVVSKSAWKNRGEPIWAFLCPVCRTQRKLPFRPKAATPKHFAQIGLTSVFFTILFWKFLGWKALASFVPFWTVFEIVYRWRTRAMIACPYCGFDPHLFVVDEQLARRAFETHWQKKYEAQGMKLPPNLNRSSRLPELRPHSEPRPPMV